MTDVAYPVVYAALLTLAQTALGSTVRVVDGYDVSQDPGDVLCLGIPDVTDSNAIEAGTWDQSMNAFGTAAGRMEEGSVNGVLLAWNGDASDAGALAARTTAFGYLSTLAQALRTTPRLGISTLSDVVAQLDAGSVLEDKVGGATCVVPITVAYKALL